MQPAERAAHYDEMNRVIAALHSVDFAARGLAGGYGKPGNYFERQIGRWSKQYAASITQPIVEMDRLIDWLPAHIPASARDDTRVSIVHGDYRIDNLMFHPQEPRVIAVLDWELSTLGHPLADFAYHCMSWHIPAALGRGIAGLDLATLGIPQEAHYIRSYCQRTGITDACYIAENKERVSGVEVELSGTVVPNWDVTVGLSAIERKYARWRDADGSISARQGQTFGNNDPTRTAQIWVLHRLQGTAQGWRAGLGLRAQNKVWSDIAANNTRPAYTIRQGGYATMNAMLSWDINRQWRAQLNVDNLTSRNYEPGYLSSSYINNSAPRSYMLALAGRF